MTPEQVSGALGLLRWGQNDLAEKTGLTPITISNYISGKSTNPSKRTLDSLARAFDGRVRFIEDRGVELIRETIQVYKGMEGFTEFLKDVHSVCKDVGGDVYVSNVNERLFERWMGDFLTEYVRIMNEIPKGHYRFRTIVEEGDTYLPSLYTDYRWISKEHYSTVPNYMYGPKLAIIVFEEHNVTVYVHDNETLVKAFRKNFELVWDNAFV